MFLSRSKDSLFLQSCESSVSVKTYIKKYKIGDDRFNKFARFFEKPAFCTTMMHTRMCGYQVKSVEDRL